ncbi:ATP-dependent RNA helicase ddx51 [Blomia tropicalis]|nr:ATP-dependent RNA helicase ddx51 [Blomia tropicalis]
MKNPELEHVQDVPMEEIDTEEPKNNEFQVIGSLKQDKVKKVNASLPKWMSDCSQFDGNIETNSSDLDQYQSLINSKLFENLQKNKITKLFPVQKTVIPCLIDSFQKMKYCQPRDVCVLSPTGSGKTLTYAIPIINHLSNRVVTEIRALIILPVSDLATQVYKVLQSLCNNGINLRVGLVTSSGKKELNQFYRKKVDGSGYICSVDILVATPGKLVDLIQHGDGFHLRHLQILVIDEADRMMNETQFQWFKEIEYSVFESNIKQFCPCSVDQSTKHNSFSNIDLLSSCSVSISPIQHKSIHKILFSATITTDPEKLDHLALFCPILFNVQSNDLANTEPKQTIPTNLKELLIITEQNRKPLIVWHLIKNLKYRRILCFTDSVISTHRLFNLAKQLPDVNITEFSSQQNIRKRSKILSDFQNGKIDMIISTDIFARGLDVTGIDCVICYDPPRNDTAYIHRIGRTARAGNAGTAISLITTDQLKHFTIISRRVHKGCDKQNPIEKLTVRESELKPLIPLYKNALKTLGELVHDERKTNLMKRHKQIKKSKFRKLVNTE